MKNILGISALLISMFVAYNNIEAIKINGKELSQIIKPKERLTYKAPIECNNICIELNSDNLEIYSFNQDTNALKKLNSDYENLKIAIKKGDNASYKHTLKGVISLESQDSSLTMNAEYLVGNKNISLKAHRNINIDDCILESKEILLISKELNIDFLIEADELSIIPNVPGSQIEAIIFKFKRNFSIVNTVSGKIDFLRNKTAEKLLVIGAQEVVIKFAPNAFGN